MTDDKSLRINFIKALEPFSTIDPTVLEQLADRIEEIDIPADHILFQQGDSAECCYLLYSGKVAILHTTLLDGSEETLAELESGAIIGELALLTDSQRNATVRALTPCKLLVVKRNEFQQLVQQSGFASSLTAMMMDRHRPKQCEGVSIHTRLNAEKNTIVILKNEAKGVYFKTSEEGLFVWNLLDGDHTIQEIAVAFFYQYHKLATDDIGALILNLMHSGFVKAPKLTSHVKRSELSLPRRLLARFAAIMQYEYSIKNVDGFITKLYQSVGYLFFTKIAKILMALFAVVGLATFITYLPEAKTTLKNMSHGWIFLFLMGPLGMLTIPFHELAHALTAKAYGNQVHRLGIGWFWLGPVAFADTSDMWLRTRGPRIIVNLAGIYINIVMAGLASLFLWIIPHSTVGVVFWFFALSNYLMVFYNLDPMFELDGYYVLMDIVDKSNLRTRAVKWLIRDFKKTVVNRELIRQYFPEIFYWIVTILFILFLSFVTYIIQIYILDSILPETIGPFQFSHYPWILSAVVIILSFMSLYFEVRKRAI